jgi:hypothetical protein
MGAGKVAYLHCSPVLVPAGPWSIDESINRKMSFTGMAESNEGERIIFFHDRSP